MAQGRSVLDETSVDHDHPVHRSPFDIERDAVRGVVSIVEEPLKEDVMECVTRDLPPEFRVGYFFTELDLNPDVGNVDVVQIMIEELDLDGV